MTLSGGSAEGNLVIGRAGGAGLPPIPAAPEAGGLCCVRHRLFPSGSSKAISPFFLVSSVCGEPEQVGKVTGVFGRLWQTKFLERPSSAAVPANVCQC